MSSIPERLVAALADRYRLERELGAGGMATVYLAEDLKHQRQVAVKVLRPDLAAALGPERFLREVGIAARLNHPHIIGLIDSGEADGFLYYVMPYVEGVSLRQKLVREGELPIPEAVRVLRDVADALAHAHRQGVVHRDIKPENVMLVERHALVMDFGVAKAVAAGKAGSGTSLTSAGVALGTPAYMAPEQATGEGHVDHRADLYAWGIVAYELLAGQPPFLRATPQNTLAAQVTAVPEPVSSHRANVPGGLARLVMQCLEKKPADRPQTAEEVLRALEAVLTPSGGMTPTASLPYVTAATRRARRRIALVGTAGVVALAVLGVAGWRWWQNRAAPIVADRVVVAPLEAEGEAFARLAQDLAALPTAMTREGIGSPVAAAVVRDLAARRGGEDPAAQAEALGRRTGAGYVLRTSCAPEGAGATCQLELFQRPANRLRMAVPVRGAGLDSTFRARVVEQALVMLRLELYWGDRTNWLGEYVTPSLEAANAAIQANELQSTNPAEWRAWRKRAAAADPDWVGVQVDAILDSDSLSWDQKDSIGTALRRRPGLTPRDLAPLDYYFAWREERVERFYELAEAGYRDWPSVNAVYYVKYAVNTNRFEQALRAAAESESLRAVRPQMYYIHWFLTPALHRLGRYQEEVARAAEIRARDPGALNRIGDCGRGVVVRLELQGRAGLGDVEGVRRLAAEERLTAGPWEGRLHCNPLTFHSLVVVPALELIAHGKVTEGDTMLKELLPAVRRHREEGDRWDAVHTEIAVLEWTGQLDEAKRLSEEVRRRGFQAERGRWRSGRPAAALGSLGRIAALQGRRAEAVAAYRELGDSAQSTRQQQDHFARATYLYFQATVAARLGDRDDAVRLLDLARNAFDAQQTPVGYTWAHKDPDLASLRGYAPYEALFRPRE